MAPETSLAVNVLKKRVLAAREMATIEEKRVREKLKS